jgi:F420-0:gamma-glutamyl ligase
VDKTDKQSLILQEASHYLPYTHPSGMNVNLTITDNMLAPAAGIDESNAHGHYVLWPQGTDELCRAIRAYLCQKNGIKNLGVISTDSHTMPLRWGVTGITTGLAGVEPLKDYRGTVDLFGRQIRLTQINQIDPLTSMAVLLMGESDEQTPMLLLRGYDKINFNENAGMGGFKISPEEDLYGPLLKAMKKVEK